MGLLDKLFIPEKPVNEFTIQRYLKDIEDGQFDDLFVLGVSESNNGSWFKKDFTMEANAFWVGTVGSGKSSAGAFTLSTYLMTNSEKCIMFIVDTIKGANDFQALFDYQQVFPVINDIDGVHKSIDLLYSELIARRELFSKARATNIKTYEQITKQQLARVIIMFEEFHQIPSILEFDSKFKEPNTSAHKFYNIMRTGRAYGIWVCAASQRSTKSDIPSEVVGMFNNKSLFKVTPGEASYVLAGNTAPASIRPDQKGRCYTDYGAVQYPYINIDTQKRLLKKYVKPFNAACAYLNFKLINDYLSGRSTEELYQLKKLAELAEGIHSFEPDLVISILHKRMKHEVKQLDSKIDPYGSSHIVTWNDGERVVVMTRVGGQKISLKHLEQLKRAIENYSCDKGILYSDSSGLPAQLYRFAVDNGIEIVDHEDLIRLCRQVDAGVINFLPDDIADRTKETGEYQKMHEKEVKETTLRVSPNPSDDDVPEIIEESDIPSAPGPTAETKFDTDDHTPIVLPPVDDDLSKLEPRKEKPVAPLPMAKSTIAAPEVSLDDDLREIREMLGINDRSIKKPKVFIALTRKPKKDEIFSILIHLQKNKNEIYRALFYVLDSKNAIRHKLFLDKKISGTFDPRALQILGVKSTEDWNNSAPIMDDAGFNVALKMFFDQFSPCEYPVTVYCWSHDVEEVKKMVTGHQSITPTPIEFEEWYSKATKSAPLGRVALLKMFDIKPVKIDIWTPIELDLRVKQAIE